MKQKVALAAGVLLCFALYLGAVYLALDVTVEEAVHVLHP